ncbi:hypothetical protein HDF24_06600 [Mucilaginibacter sp. X4EP1]|uniref:hypothetical protein n=1 Tax=Mucilaginibacter sp. X4EP1 TaxID=2723092 RepID=UPI0021687AC6|nr:hypothetical protein [Mucilaginibacter sp. X4EP1]MCS3813975.1 hypothetical protein [Mucilaginibacter sp. X4EP1]
MMRQNQKNNTAFLLTIIGVLLGFNASAQQTFKYSAFLNKVDSSGFYKISLGPDIARKSNSDFSDIRLMDPKGNFVPYVTEGNLPQVQKQKFIVYPEVKVDLNTDTGTSFIVENISKQPLSSLWIKLKNTAVSRLVNLSGSDDLKNWYAIEEAIPLQEAVLNSDGTYEQSLSFPASSYRYLKLLVNDKNKTAVKFLEAGEYVEKPVPVAYLPVLLAPFTRRDSNKVTFITVKLNDNYLVNRLHLAIAGPKFYNREVSIYQVNKYGNELLCIVSLNSKTKQDVFISARTNKLVLKIENGDNLPLDIKGINVYQAEHYIVSYLEKGKLYKLFTGDEDAVMPQYDLKFFTDSISHVMPLEAGPIMKNDTYLNSPVTAKRDYSILIWIASAAALLLLLLLTLKMIKEVNNKNGQ